MSQFSAFSTETLIVWANSNYFHWNVHSLSQLQLFQLKHWFFEPIETASTESALSVKIATFSSQMRIIWANFTDFKWNTHSLHQLQLLQAKDACSVPIATISTETHIVFAYHNNLIKMQIIVAYCYYFNWNNDILHNLPFFFLRKWHSLSSLQLSDMKHA